MRPVSVAGSRRGTSRSPSFVTAAGAASPGRPAALGPSSAHGDSMPRPMPFSISGRGSHRLLAPTVIGRVEFCQISPARCPWDGRWSDKRSLAVPIALHVRRTGLGRVRGSRGRIFRQQIFWLPASTINYTAWPCPRPRNRLLCHARREDQTEVRPGRTVSVTGRRHPPRSRTPPRSRGFAPGPP